MPWFRATAEAVVRDQLAKSLARVPDFDLVKERCPVIIRGGWQLSTGHHKGLDLDLAIAELRGLPF